MRPFGSRHLLFALIVAVAVEPVALGCGPSRSAPAADAGDAGEACSAGPQACPSVVPSYGKEVAPILQTYCVGCHGSDGGEGFDAASYAGVSAQMTSVLDEVEMCSMPPAGSPPLSEGDRLTLLYWLVCGALDN